MNNSIIVVVALFVITGLLAIAAFGLSSAEAITSKAETNGTTSNNQYLYLHRSMLSDAAIISVPGRDCGACDQYQSEQLK